ncbi:MAG: Flp family type IVb pilin [Actinomycetota bacterium]|nr:Flp family type IVb pilin [Actinomycetota bacterium]
MLKIYSKIQGALKSDKGAAAVEYALLVALIALVMAVGAFALGGGLNTLFNAIGLEVGGATVTNIP